MKVPQFMPSRMRLLSRNRTFNSSKANNRLGYTPIIPFEDGLRGTIESYSHLRVQSQIKKEGPSKASIYLGSGRVADILLWRDAKKTLVTILILAAIYFNFIASSCTMVTAVGKLFLAVSIFLVIHVILPEKIFGHTIEKIPRSKFHFPEEKSHQVALSVASPWNVIVKSLKSICKGNDWPLFFKVVVSLLILSILGAVSLQRIFTIGVPYAFVAFIVYVKKRGANRSPK